MTDFILILIFSFIIGAAVQAVRQSRRSAAIMGRAQAFELWWRNNGSALRPADGEDTEAHARRVAAQAFDAGFDCRDAA